MIIKLVDVFNNNGISQDFPRGAPTPKMGTQTYYVGHFPRKLHKIAKEIGPRVGGGASLETRTSRLLGSVTEKLPVADPGFSLGAGGTNSQSGCTNLLFCNFFCQKLYENQIIWTPMDPGGVTHPWHPPLDPPMATVHL